MAGVSAAARDNTGARRYIEGVGARALPARIPSQHRPPPLHACRATAARAARVSEARPPPYSRGVSERALGKSPPHGG